MSVATGDQVQEFCRILVLTDEGTGNGTATLNNAQLECQTCEDASLTMNYQKSANLEMNSSDLFPSPCLISSDIEKGVTNVSLISQDETAASVKTEIALTKPLRRQNSLRTGGDSIPPLMNHLLMLLKFDTKEKQPIERTYDAAINNKWKKYKRAASFDARQIVLLFSVL